MHKTRNVIEVPGENEPIEIRGEIEPESISIILDGESRAKAPEITLTLEKASSKRFLFGKGFLFITKDIFYIRLFGIGIKISKTDKWYRIKMRTILDIYHPKIGGIIIIPSEYTSDNISTEYVITDKENGKI